MAISLTNGQPSTTTTVNGTSHDSNSKAYKVHEKELFAPRPIKVVCIGAGLSGIFLGARLPMLTENVELVIYEKNPEVGGTWYENKYPGAACDVPSHRYQYTWEPNPRWSEFYSPAAEIQRYLHDTAVKYDVMKYIKFETKVTSAIWDEESGKWKLKLRNVKTGEEFEDETNILINAMGVLNDWKWPDIKGIKDYKGILLHTANWDTSVSLEGLNVASIGSGSSAIQLVPAMLQDKVSHIDSYFRSNTWILPRLGAEHMNKTADGQLIYEYSNEEIETFEKNPEALLEYRRKLEKDVSAAFHLFLREDDVQKKVCPEIAEYMRKQLSSKPGLAEKMIPNWPVGCRRLTPGVGFLEALVKPNVDSIFDEISHFDETGIVTKDGTHRKYDAIACATGFNVSYNSRFPFIGRDGAQLDDDYAANPYSYFALAVPGFPNYFVFNGPNAPVGAGSLIPGTEAQGEYMIKASSSISNNSFPLSDKSNQPSPPCSSTQAIQKFQRQDIKSMEPNREKTLKFVEHTDAWMPRSVWSTGCRSWYKNGKVNGRVTALWPGTGLHYIDSLSEPRWEDFDYTYADSTNPYSFLGDGFTHIEHTGEDRTWDLGIRTARMQTHPALHQGEGKKKVVTNGSSKMVLDETNISVVA
ncbi:putative flavin-binding monooxygenase [Meredithblackwellia eburnea MCA 4105]